MRVGIVGSRNYPSEPTVRSYVRSLPAGTVVVSGGARGVDSWAEDEARRCGLETRVFRPLQTAIDFGGFAYAAHRRNKQIAEFCDRLVAFSLNCSRGTGSTIRYARELGRPTEVYEWPAVPGCGEECLDCGAERRSAGTGEDAPLSPPEPHAPNGGR
jgi:predicted Rossmann fold nucleotide-binding protein DprA/Smf involved in DNA uptake